VPFVDLLGRRYQWFESSFPVDYEILVQLVPRSAFSINSCIETPLITVNEVNGDNYLVRRADNPFIAEVDIISKKVSLMMWESQYCFDSFLRVFYSLVLAEEGGLVLHGASVCKEGRGRVFFGPSGSGKTTVAKLSQGLNVLTDELVIIRPQNGTYQVYGTPFWGEFSPGRSNIQAELIGLYSLRKDPNNSLVLMDKLRAVTELYQCVLFFGKGRRLLGCVLDACCALADQVPVYELHFRPDPDFWRVVDDKYWEDNHAETVCVQK